MADFFTEKGKLDNQTIHDRILAEARKLKLSISKKIVEEIIDQFWFHDFYNSFIAGEAYFKHLLTYLTKTKFKTFNRFDYYSFLFDQITSKSDRQGLYSIALEFENQQEDAFTPKKFNEVVKKLKLPLKKFDFKSLEKKHLVKMDQREGVEYVILEHHTLTEFLVAELLVNQSKTVESFEKLAVLKQEGLTAFKSSWSGVLRFLLESEEKINTLKWLLDFLEEYPDNIDDNLSELITFSVEIGDQETKARIFNLIYESYFKRLTWLPVWARNNLYRFLDKNSYTRLKKDIKKWPNKTETFVRRGNVAAIVGGILENNANFLTQNQKDFWKKTFIGFIKNPNDEGNGVLQRHCLSALETYKDARIVKHLESEKLLDSQDSLVRDAFISLCRSVANSQIAIDNLIEGLKKGSDIYARHGLYQISKKGSLKYFLSKIADDEKFLSSFLEHESIFDKEDGDQQLIKKIRQLKDKKNIKVLKKLFFNFLELDIRYELGQSNFVKEITLMIASQDKKFLFEIIKGIQSVEKEKIHHRFFDYENFIAILLTENNLEEYFKTVANVPEIHRRASFPIYIAKRINGKTGEKVYRMTLKLKKIEQPVASPHEEPWEKQQKQQKKRRREQFINLLGKDDKFFTNLFQYYLQSKVELDQFFKTSKGKTSKKRLIKLAVNGINKIDPKKFQVSIQDRSAKKFTWSTQASYFGDLLEVVSIFKPQLIKKYLQKIIDFIPYAYSDDMARIMDMVAEVSNNDLSFVNRVMKDLKNDIRYLVPGTYIYLVGHYAKKGCNLSNAAPVLKSFIDDDEILDYERRNALENLEYVVKKPDEKLKQYLLSLFEEENVIFKNSVNALLITLYKDESAIDWRFAKLKEPIKFDRRRIEGKAHSVGQEERELDSLSFAKPLIELKDEKYLPKFLKLINYSINFYLALEGEENRNTYKEFVNYILRIVIAYVDNLKYIKSFNPVFRLENFIDKKTENYPDLNSLKIRIEELKKSYVNFNSIN